MKNLLIPVLALSMMAVPAAFAQTEAQPAPQDAQTAPAPLKNIKGTIKMDGDKATFVSDSDQKSWEVMNPEAVKEHDGHHVQVSAHVYADKGTIHVMSVKMLKQKSM